MRAADVLVATLRSHGVQRVFCVPGESYLAVLDALADAPDVQVVTCRHESGAGLMALAEAKLTGRPAVAFVSRGPGACNASIAVHSAEQDANPLVLFVGQVDRKDRHRGAFQEVDYERTFSGLGKWAVEINDAARIPELVTAAFHTAADGTPGPVIVALPEDMLADEVNVPVLPPRRLPDLAPASGDVEAAAELIEAAERPLLIVGGAARSQAAREALLMASEAWNLPVAVTNKHQDVFPNRHRLWAGHLGYAAPRVLMSVLERADLVIAIGTRLGDVQTQGYTFPRAPEPDQPLIHVYPDPTRLGRVHATRLSVVAAAEPFFAALAARPPRAARPQGWPKEVNAAAAGLMAWSPRRAEDGLDFGHVIAALAQQLSDDAIVTLDSGNFVSWAHRHFPFKTSQTLIGAVSGAMGLGVPAAVAAALRHPDRQVVALVGDGGFLMTGNELATAMRYGAPIRVFIANNGSYGTIRTHQELAFPGRVHATGLTNPDFVSLAKAFGARGYLIQSADEVGAVVAEALAGPGPAVVDVRTSLELISANATISGIRSR